MSARLTDALRETAARTDALLDRFLAYPSDSRAAKLYEACRYSSLDGGKRIRPFCTHEGSGLSRAVQDIQKAAPGAVVTKGLALYGSGVDSARAALEQWVREVEK